MSSRPELIRARFKKCLEAIARWEAKERRARNALRKLRRQRAYYLRSLGPKPVDNQAKADRLASSKANKIARGTMAAREIAMRELYRTTKRKGKATA